MNGKVREMKLTKEETKRIDDALEALKRSLRDEMKTPAGKSPYETMDDVFLKKIADGYLSKEGILCMMNDLTVAGIVCNCSQTCVTPNKVACTRAGTIE
jgi:hypothetical protein